ncbi:hypothetical protein CR513_11052, partial [Mucuna pruriens]
MEDPDGRVTIENSPQVKDKSQVVCYECKKHGHFKYECPSLEKEKKKEKKKILFNKKKGLMATWEDLDLDEEANINLMANTTSEGEEDNKKVIFNDTNNLQIEYQEILSNSSTMSIGYNDLKKKFSKLSEELDVLQKENDLFKKENESLKEKKDKELSTINTLEINEKLQEEVIDLRQSLIKFVNGYENLIQTQPTKSKIILGRRYQSWYMDSDYSHHMMGERSIFQDLRPKSGG